MSLRESHVAEVDLAAVQAANAKRWQAAKLTRTYTTIARALVAPAAKAHYLAVQNVTGVPWYFVAVVHEREADQIWTANLAQGDPWDKVSVHVPAGRGPFKSWSDAAIDALTNCPPFAARNKDWTIGPLLTWLERYNGLGYAERGLPSPYVWAGTDQYSRGKYVADGVFNPNIVDRQPGCAALLMTMMLIDKSVLQPVVTS
jgi:lysozyme family protein